MGVYLLFDSMPKVELEEKIEFKKLKKTLQVNSPAIGLIHERWCQMHMDPILIPGSYRD